MFLILIMGVTGSVRAILVDDFGRGMSNLLGPARWQAADDDAGVVFVLGENASADCGAL